MLLELILTACFIAVALIIKLYAGVFSTWFIILMEMLIGIGLALILMCRMLHHSVRKERDKTIDGD